jgi:hypothetical protein
MKGFKFQFFLWYLVFFGSLLFSCKKSEDRVCFKGTGKQGRLEISVSSFDKLDLYEHIEYELIQDSLDKVVIKGGKNLLNRINILVDDFTLIIKNENKCAFLRTYKNVIKVEIHFTNLNTLNYFGTELLTNLNSLKLNSLSLMMKNGSGTIQLNLDTDQLRVNVSSGYGNFILNGSAKYANIQVGSNGFCDAYGLSVADSISVVSNTPSPIKINADHADLRAEIKNGGDIYYIGAPSTILFNQYGNGKLIDKN